MSLFSFNLLAVPYMILATTASVFYRHKFSECAISLFTDQNQADRTSDIPTNQMVQLVGIIIAILHTTRSVMQP